MRYQFGLFLLAGAIAIGSEKVAQFERIMDRFGASEPSVSVAVVLNGKTVALASRGLADLEQRKVAGPKTNYRLASVTKQFTATAIQMLVAEGKLRLAQTLTEFLPEFPPYAKSITIRHLLTHTSGLWDYEELIPASQTSQFKDAEAVTYSATHTTLYFEPGSKFQYSNTGYAALSEIVRKVSGMRFADFLKARVFDPIGMKGTVAHEEGISRVADRAYGYVPGAASGKFERKDQSQTSAVLGDGGIYSSLEDLILWNSALDEAKLLPRARLDEAVRTSTLTSGEPLRYGFGWFLDDYGRFRRQWHGGETVGFRTAIQRFPEQRLAVIVLSNRNNLDAKKLSLEVADLWLGR